MFRFILLLAPLLLFTAACDSGGSDDDTPVPEGNVDDGSVDFADGYIADVSGTDASFFLVNSDGPCTAASLRITFSTERFELACTTMRDGEVVTVDPSGTFRYELSERAVTIRTSIGYALEGTAPTNGDFIDGEIRRSNGQRVEIRLLAVR